MHDSVDMCGGVTVVGLVEKITSNLSLVASGLEPSSDGWMCMGDGGGVTSTDSRMSPVLGRATCFPQPPGPVLDEIRSTSFSIKDKREMKR